MKKQSVKMVFLLMIITIVTTSAAMAVNLSNNSNNINSSNDINTGDTDADSIKILLSNDKFINHGLKVTELEEGVKLTKSMAIAAALKEEGDTVKGATRITAVKCRFTDTANLVSKLPEKNIYFDNYPVWVVTFYGVNVPTNGPAGQNGLSETVFADENVIVDANTGEVLEIIAYNAN